MRNRLVIDVSSIARWAGPPVGITRVEQQLAAWARHQLNGTLFALFDPRQLRYREVRSPWLESILDGQASLDTLGLPNPTRPGRRRSDRIPPFLQSMARWGLQFRRTLLMTLEAHRLRAPHGRAASAIDALQRRLMSEKYRRFMVQADGSRRALVHWDQAAGPEIELGRGDLLVCAGYGWNSTNIDAIRALKQRSGFRMAVLCYDIIPLLFTQFYKRHDVEAFDAYWRGAFATADLIVFTAQKVRDDAIAYFARENVPPPSTAIVPLGADGASRSQAAQRVLPQGLERGRFALFVSTVEPRKGHRLLYEVWLRLLAEGIPQAHSFKLAFVGRSGWMVDELVQLLRNDPRLRGNLVWLPNVDDATLDAMYRETAFCLYPSRYEGYGLPVVEAFQRGKAVIASAGGALSEVVGAFSPCLDPDDQDRWYATLKQWIEDPAAREAYERKIRSDFRHPTWREAAALFFSALQAKHA
jgi:glycosyltransferase involved in cell wall biosynthesis